MWQAFPAFLLGAWTPIPTPAVLAGATAGIVFTLLLICFETIAKADSTDAFTSVWLLASPDGEQLNSSVNVIVGALLNVVVSLSVWQCCSSTHNVGDSDADLVPLSSRPEFGQLSYRKIEEIMEGILEPLTYKKGLWIWLAVFFILCSFLPKMGSVASDLDPTMATQMLNNGEINSVIAGLPVWAFWDLMLNVCAIVCGIYGAGFWSVESTTVRVDDDDDTVVSKVKKAIMEGKCSGSGATGSSLLMSERRQARIRSRFDAEDTSTSENPVAVAAAAAAAVVQIEMVRG